jgi:PAS domain S-box-containing protein
LTLDEELTYYKKAYLREKLARKEAEEILESKAEELYKVNSQLLALNLNLEENLIQRTERIKEVEKEFSKMVKAADVMIYKTDIKGKLTFINQTGEKTSEYSSTELIGTKFSEIVQEDQKMKMIHFYKTQLIKNIDSTYLEFPITTKNGKQKWIGQNVQLIVKDNSPNGFWAVARDITERVKNDNELKKSNQKYKSLFEGAFDGVVRLDSKGCFVEWNLKMETLLGFNASELKGMHITNIIHEEDLEKSKAYFKKLVDNGFYTNYVGRIKSKYGRIIDIEVNSRATLENGKITGSIDSVRDITERKTLEKEIIISEEKYRGIIENLDFGLLEVNLNGTIEKAHSSFCNLTGYTPKELIGRNPLQFLHPDFIPLMEKKTKSREQGIADVYEVKIKHKSGSYIWVIISGAPFYDEFGELSGSIGVHLDISSQKKMESDLINANNIAIASSKSKELFLANMTHEIRTPLNAVFGLSNLLKKTDLNNSQITYVENINNSAQTLLLLVNDILDISKIESGKTEANPTKFNIRKTLKTIFSSISHFSDRKNLKLKLNIDDKLDETYLGDELKICQILINLLNNAIKFTSEGEINLTIKKVYNSGKEHQIEMSVSDTGKGVAKEALESIFDDFTQEDNTISKKYGGTGLGLSISKKLVSVLGGELKVESTLNIGSKFYFKIPLSPVDQDKKEDNKSIEYVIDWSSIKILTAEDNAVNQFVIESTIKNWGGSTDIAQNGEEVIKMIKKKDYDIILMDLQMPIMDGISTTIFIRQELKSEIPIIAFTANALKKQKDRCFAIGMNDYITKPFEQENLKSKIRNLLLDSKPNSDINIINSENEPLNTLFNISKLKSLACGDNVFIIKMLKIFCEEGSNQLEQIINSNNAEEISKIAHKIKPSLDYLTNDALKNLVRKIEKKEFVGNKNLLNDFTFNLRELIAFSKEYIKNNN